jgi:phosphocarrier protein FPr
LSALTLVSPLSGRLMPLAQSPDPVFSTGLIGDGVAIDPDVGELRAPCDGTVTTVHTSGHAITVTADNGAEILIHLGVDTVNLQGAGFRTLVRKDQRVTAGTPLIRFDMAAIAPKVTSLVSMMVVANGDAFRVTPVRTDGAVTYGAAVATVSPVGAEAETAAAPAGEGVTLTLPLKIAHGLHARPAAQLANAAKAHAGSVTVTVDGKTVNAKSVVALMGLGTRFGDVLDIRVEGDGADATADALVDLILSGLGDPIADAPAPEAEIAAMALLAAPVTTAAVVPGAGTVLRGRSAVAGLAVGPVTRHGRTAWDLPRDGAGAAAEHGRLAAARATVAAGLAATTAGPRAAIAAAHAEILADPALIEAAEAEIAAGRSAEWAWNAACNGQADVLAGMSDARMAERAADLRDIAGQVVAVLTGRDGGTTLARLPAGSIVLAGEILPSETAGLTAGHLAAILMRDGGPTSHAAIIAAGLGIPTVVAIGAAADRIPDGVDVIVDAGLGTVTISPSEAELATARTRAAQQAHAAAAERAAAGAEAQLSDGTRIAVFANLGRVGEGALAVAAGAEGCGLLRSEFLFLDRAAAPSEDEQLAEYQALADELGGRPLVIRTLDVGGDKPLPYLPLPKEENPFLGLRGIRVGLARPELLRAQIRAILRVKPYGVARILVPMVASAAEMASVRRLVDMERAALGRAEPIEIGAMIEIPAAAVAARQLAEVSDFFSVGTNDLTQYALAMDRGNPAVAAGVDALHPGVLGLIKLACDGAAARGRGVAVCGGAASDPLAAPILVGLGVTELSAAPAAVPAIKAALAGVSLDRCKALAEQALAAAGPAEVRAIAAVATRDLQP